MALPDGVFRCIKFEAEFVDYGTLYPGYTAGILTWTPDIVGGKLVGGTLHGDVPLDPTCDPENHTPVILYTGVLGFQIKSCKTLKVEVTGDGSGFTSYPNITLRTSITSDYILAVSSPGSSTPCPVSTQALIPTPAYALPNPAYIAPDCGYILYPGTADDGSFTYTDNSYFTLQVTGYNSFSAAHTFDITLSLV